MVIMSLHLYSTLLAVGALFVLMYSGMAVCAYLFSVKTRAAFSLISYAFYIKIIGTLAVIASSAALLYQFAYGLQVCELCWWQRIAMFPIDAIALAYLFSSPDSRGTRVHISIALLALFGLSVASWHFYEHVRSFVFGLTSNLPCSAVGLTPSCSESPILIFGFMTIPGMAVCIFASILILCFFAHKSKA
jgi:disulfide bond formation protein DsbB